MDGVNIVTLNIGCGPDPRGDIRIDIDPYEPGTNLIADAQHLPLRTKSVHQVYSKSMLEHLPNPHKCLLDIQRVTRNTAIIIVPNVLRFTRIIRTLLNPMHKVDPGTTHFQAWDEWNIKYLVNQIPGLEIVDVVWKEYNGTRPRFLPRCLFCSHMKVTLKVNR